YFRIPLHRGKKIVAERLVIAAVDNITDLILYLCSAYNPLYRVLRPVHQLVSKNKCQRNKIEFRKVLNVLDFHHTEVVSLLQDLQRKYFIEPERAYRFGFSSIPPAFRDVEGKDLSLNRSFKIIVAEYPFPRKLRFE